MLRPVFLLAAALMITGAARPSGPPIAGPWREELNGAPHCRLTFAGNRLGSAGTVRYVCPGRRAEVRRWTLRGRQLVVRTSRGEYVMRYERVDAGRFHAELYPEGGRRWSDLVREKP